MERKFVYSIYVLKDPALIAISGLLSQFLTDHNMSTLNEVGLNSSIVTDSVGMMLMPSYTSVVNY
jgi:hypothetical protein